jgi:hypothetical protein
MSVVSTCSWPSQRAMTALSTPPRRRAIAHGVSQYVWRDVRVAQRVLVSATDCSPPFNRSDYAHRKASDHAATTHTKASLRIIRLSA